jgi:GT2 family glycosyltransferase
MKRVYVLLVNWNGWADTLECLESVFRLDYSNLRAIVCDNGSSDGSVEKIVAWADGGLVPPTGGKETPGALKAVPVAKHLNYVVYDRQQAETGGEEGNDPPLILIRTGGNLGFAGGNNVGLRYAMARGDCSHVWLINNDTVVTPRALSALLERMQEKPSAGMCGSTLVHYDRPDRIQARGGGWYCRWIGLPWHLGRLQRVGDPPRLARVEKWMNYVVGASLLVSREFIENIGLMCEDYFLFFEETDWALRSKGRYTLAYAPDSIVYHKVGRSIGTSSDPRLKSAICDYYTIRNRLLFTRRFFPAVLPAVYCSVGTALLVRLFLGQWERVGMIWRLLTVDPGSQEPLR